MARTIESLIPPVFGGPVKRYFQNDPAEIALRNQNGFFFPGTNNLVSETQALQIVAFFACVQRLSSDIAKLPLEVYKTTTREGKSVTDVDYEHPSYWLIHESPNDRDTAVEMWEYVLANAFIRGKGYCYIKRNGFNDPVELWPIANRNVREFSYEGGQRRGYEIKDIGVVDQEDMIVVRNFLNTNPVEQFNRTTGLSWSADDYATSYFRSGGAIAGVLEFPNELKKEQKDNLSNSWNDAKAKGHQVRLIEYGGKFTKFTNDPAQSQLVESRKFNAEDICRIFQVPPSIVGYSSDAKYNSVEQVTTHYVQHTLLSHIKRIEQQLNKRLLRANQKVSHAIKYNLKAMLRGDIKTQSEYYEKMLAKGVLSINEVRSLENMNPVPGGDGRLVQVNQIPLEFMDEYGKKISAEGAVNTAQNES